MIYHLSKSFLESGKVYILFALFAYIHHFLFSQSKQFIDPHALTLLVSCCQSHFGRDLCLKNNMDKTVLSLQNLAISCAQISSLLLIQ